MIRFFLNLFAIGCLFNLYADGSAMQNTQPPKVAIVTNLGQIVVKLFPNIAPKACENFLGLADKHYYDGVTFHRVIPQFMIQGGDPTGTGAGGESIWGASFTDECKMDVRFDRPGLLAMANRGPNTNGSQFFITTASTPWLNGKHTIFGEVVEGFDVLNKIEMTKTDSQKRPFESVRMIEVKIIK